MPRTGIQSVGGKRASVSRHLYDLTQEFSLNVSTGDTKGVTADGNYEVLYELEVDKGIAEWFGRGNNENPLQAQGFLGVRLVEDGATAQAKGTYRIAVRNSSGRRLYNIYEGNLENDDLYTGAAGSGTLKDRKDREPFPNSSNAYIGEPRVITIDVNVDSDITVDDAESETSAKIEGFRAEALE